MSPIQQSRIARQLGLGKHDLQGLVFDRDIVAFYGDPAWQAKMANGKNNWNQKLSHKKKKFVFTINPTNGSNSYEPINTNGVQRGYRPFVEFFEKRIGKVQIISGLEYNPVITDTFILVPSPSPGHGAEKIEIIFEEKN
jgi:zinc protease